LNKGWEKRENLRVERNKGNRAPALAEAIAEAFTGISHWLRAHMPSHIATNFFERACASANNKTIAPVRKYQRAQHRQCSRPLDPGQSGDSVAFTFVQSRAFVTVFVRSRVPLDFPFARQQATRLPTASHALSGLRTPVLDI